MFEDNKITKLKKDQFIEAESVAYLIKDEQKRKLSFINTCALFAFKNYIEKNKYPYEPITNINLFRVPLIAEKYEISDLYIGNFRIDVRVSLDGKLFPIPICHIKNELAPDFYVVYKRTKNPLKCEALGYIKKDDLIFDTQDNMYYYISVSILNPIENLKNELIENEKEEKTFFDTEHKIASENIGAFLDEELDEIKSLDLIQHMMECKDCRGMFVEYSFLEDVLSAVKHYPDLKEELDNKISESEKQEQIQNTEENILENETIPIINDSDNSEEEISNIQEETSFDINDEKEEEEFVDLSMSDFTFYDDTTEESLPEDNNLDINELNTSIENYTDSTEQIDDENFEIFETSPENELTLDENIIELDDNNPSPEKPEISNDNILPNENSSENDFINNMPTQNDELNIDIASNDNKEPLIETASFENQNTQSVEIDIMSEEDTNSISLEDILIDSDNTPSDIEEPLQNNEKDKTISNDTPEPVQEDSLSINTNWNELFTNNSGLEQTTEQIDYENTNNSSESNQESNYTTSEIETLYDNAMPDGNIENSTEESIDKTIEKSTEKEKKSMNIPVIAVFSVILISILAGGVFMSGKLLNTQKNKLSQNQPDYPVSGDSQNNMNKAMTNAFSDTNQTLNVTKLSWRKNKQATPTPELKEYMLTMGKMISDELDNNLMSVQGYIAENPMKISILINKSGEIKAVKVTESCGAEEVDEVLLQSTKTVIDKNPPSFYGVTGENINLILVVNF